MNKKIYKFIIGTLWSIIGIFGLLVWVLSLFGVVELGMPEIILFPFLFLGFTIGGISQLWSLR